MQNLDGEHSGRLEVRVRIVRQYERSLHGNLVAVVREDRCIDNYGIANFSNLSVSVHDKRFHIAVYIELSFADTGIEIVVNGACDCALELVVQFNVREGECRYFCMVYPSPDEE